MAENKARFGVLGRVLNLPNDDPKKTLFVAFVLCLVCAVLVSSAAVALRDKQLVNKKNDIKKNILAVTDVAQQGDDINALFKQFEVKLVDLKTGDYSSDFDPNVYDQRTAAQDPATSVALSGDEDIASIGRRANVATVYLLKDGDTIKQVVLPVHGYGLWSTLYGFLSLEGDFNTIHGLKFYEQAETPGLGGEVENPRWRAIWKGKKAFDEQGNVKIRVIRGHVDDRQTGAEYQVDGLSGATLTSNGVTNMVTYWLGDDGFGPYLKKMRSELGK
jgi:Na+-transporting NADH:ubiquinone oxidoreductase subunit C